MHLKLKFRDTMSFYFTNLDYEFYNMFIELKYKHGWHVHVFHASPVIPNSSSWRLYSDFTLSYLHTVLV